jgi:hypothetical protein
MDGEIFVSSLQVPLISLYKTFGSSSKHSDTVKARKKARKGFYDVIRRERRRELRSCEAKRADWIAFLSLIRFHSVVRHSPRSIYLRFLSAQSQVFGVNSNEKRVNFVFLFVSNLLRLHDAQVQFESFKLNFSEDKARVNHQKEIFLILVRRKRTRKRSESNETMSINVVTSRL